MIQQGPIDDCADMDVVDAQGRRLTRLSFRTDP
jgi:hypothetical protein